MKRLLLVLLLCCPPLFASTDPCNSDQTLKQHAFATPTTATTTSLIAVPANPAQSIYVCAATVQLFSTTTVSTAKLITGTGAACSSPADATALYTNAAGTSATVPLPGLKVPALSGLCIVTTVGSTPSIAVDVTFVTQ